VDGVARAAQLVGEADDTGREPERVVEQDDLGHASSLIERRVTANDP
jgi:hypothetical protein